MTVTKCAECPFLIIEPTVKKLFCAKLEKYIIEMWVGFMPNKCPIASGKPFTISFTPIEETKNN